jgi:general secretion pathway protein G
MTRKQPRTNEDGYTLIELLVVLGIIALLVALVAPQVVRYLGDARSQTAKTQMKNIESALELYYLEVGGYPTSADGLKALVEKPAAATKWNGPYLRNAQGLNDPWGKPFIYTSPGTAGAFDISSLGRDGKSGGEGEDADVVVGRK